MASKLFAVRLAPEGIGAYDVQPGIIENADDSRGARNYERRIADGLTPLPRMGQPDDIARMVLALARAISHSPPGRSSRPTAAFSSNGSEGSCARSPPGSTSAR